MNKTKVVANSRWMFRCKSWNCLRGLVSVKPYSEYVGLFATNGEEDPQINLQIRIWTALRSLGPEFFTVCNAMSTVVDITFFWVIVPKNFRPWHKVNYDHIFWRIKQAPIFVSKTYYSFNIPISISMRDSRITQTYIDFGI